MERWHAGLRVTGERRLSDAELETIRAIRRGTWSQFAIEILRLVMIVATPYALTLLPLNDLAHALVLFAIPGALVVMMSLGVPAAAAQTLALPRLLQRDLRRGVVESCSGSVDEMVTGDIPEFLSGSTLSAADEQCEIEVLPHSHLLWSLNGVKSTELRQLRSSVTAQAPQHAQLAAQFVRRVDADAPVMVHSRALSLDELRELESYAPTPHAADLGLPLLLWLSAAAALGVGMTHRWSSLVVPFLLALLALALTPRAVRSVRARRWIAPDVREGRVVIIRALSSDDDGNEELSPPVEFLPHSKVVWSERWGPATWRRIVNGPVPID